MPNKNDLSAIKLLPKKTLTTTSQYKKPWPQPKPPEEKCSEAVMLKFTPWEMEKIKKDARLAPLATYIKKIFYKNR